MCMSVQHLGQRSWHCTAFGESLPTDPRTAPGGTFIGGISKSDVQAFAAFLLLPPALRERVADILEVLHVMRDHLQHLDSLIAQTFLFVDFFGLAPSFSLLASLPLLRAG